MLVIDGSQGEGGGQILRSSLALSLVTGRAFQLDNIRAGRRKPGLMRQHLLAVQTAAAVGRAEVTGDRLGSGELTFRPNGIHPGDHTAAVATAGSAMLVLQAVLPALVTADGPSRLSLVGGTHNPFSPPADFLAKAFLPLLGRMGSQVELNLQRHGFYPAGGGRAGVTIAPTERLAPLNLADRGEIRARRVRGLVANLPASIAQREVDTVCEQLSWGRECQAVQEVDSPGPGNAVLVEIESEHVTEVFTGFGQRGVPAERVGHELAKQVRRYLAAPVAVGRHLADQLLLPMALAGRGRFTTLAPTRHTTTNADIIQSFLDVPIAIEQQGKDDWEIRIGNQVSSVP